ncbi:hypothetical protein UREG_02060 [Uncinocarpus reesii 1704]|uniref:Metallo-beta-lactamase domain-containing protein n=1 Tax=Uncinocarpus reesii (strain UAMH 1704) TaxID=336963 RepID=C4JKA3_UNCRE|nr:uncharacterized protein UREG_02060 [Uncinocarpus reesii 1704]EEP77211.1 hypothetical protein UREG_02060 [Uncinocarpus reesii 1704]
MSETTSPSATAATDFENAHRGFIGALDPCIIKASDGRTVWNNEEYKFLQEECPPTANRSLWRQGRLCSIQGLFEVTPGIYQVRGFDISNLTIVEGKDGIIVIDPLVSVECAAAALDLYRTHRGNRSVTGLIYSHPHMDHLGGARGVLPTMPDPSIPIIGPEGFMEELTSEHVYANDAMRRRAAYMFGSHLPKGPAGQIGCGLGMTVSSGTNSLIPPNLLIRKTGEEHTIDGVRIIFQMVPGSEAPAEINFFFPDHRALCIAECATHTMHNIITLRGAQVRDARAWSRYLDESLAIFGPGCDVLFASHHWPTWGQENIANALVEQRDLYAYLHDQTLRMANAGKTGIEIAEELALPPTLQEAWHVRGYYGSVSHNVKGIYQRYMTWFDGNPAHLWQHPPAEEGKRYVECMGGTQSVIAKAQEYAAEGDLRFAATILDHAVAADRTHREAKLALAGVYETLGFGAENGTWRNFYLTEAQNLRQEEGNKAAPMAGFGLPAAVEELLGVLSIRLDGLKAANERFAIEIHIPRNKERWRVNLSNGALTYRCLSEESKFNAPSGLTLTRTRACVSLPKARDSALWELPLLFSPDIVALSCADCAFILPSLSFVLEFDVTWSNKWNMLGRECPQLEERENAGSEKGISQRRAIAVASKGLSILVPGGPGDMVLGLRKSRCRFIHEPESGALGPHPPTASFSIFWSRYEAGNFLAALRSLPNDTEQSSRIRQRSTWDWPGRWPPSCLGAASSPVTPRPAVCVLFQRTRWQTVSNTGRAERANSCAPLSHGCPSPNRAVPFDSALACVIVTGGQNTPPGRGPDIEHLELFWLKKQLSQRAKMNHTRQPRIQAWEGGGYSTPRSVTQHLVPHDPSRVIFDSAKFDGSSSLDHDVNDAESRSTRRRGFWARLKRSKSDGARRDEGVSTVPNKAAPRPARTGGTLVWDAEQEIWLFARNDGTLSNSPWNERRLSVPMSTSSSESAMTYAEEDLLFAQLPGHYPLSNIYNCINHDQALPEYDPIRHADDVGRRTSSDGQWMLVARRIGQSTSTD